MTEQDQDAIVGKTVRELRDIREKLAKLRAKCSDFADSFSTAEHHLRSRLEFLRLVGETTDGRFVQDQRQHSSYGREEHIPKKETLSIDAVLAIRDEIRACVLEEQRLELSLSSMGFKS